MATRVRPILKWPGGKFRLLDAILPELGAGERLVEPFVGSGAVFMNADFPSYLLCDINPDLIGFFETLAGEGDAFVERCRELFTADANTPEVYYERRDHFNRLSRDDAGRAALFLYFNRHGYNGLIRYNAKGDFNVPFGRYAKPYFPAAEMAAFLDKARRCRLRFLVADFQETFAEVRKGDVVYCDPPYIPLSATANFTSYAGNLFAAGEQERLAELAEAAGDAGVRVVVSNHDAGAARRLYQGASHTREVAVRRFISCNGEKREIVNELLAVYQ